MTDTSKNEHPREVSGSKRRDLTRAARAMEFFMLGGSETLRDEVCSPPNGYGDQPVAHQQVDDSLPKYTVVTDRSGGTPRVRYVFDGQTPE